MQIKPPEGYRLLKSGERIRKGDLYNRGGSWHETRNPNGKWTEHGHWPMARSAKKLTRSFESASEPGLNQP